MTKTKYHTFDIGRAGKGAVDMRDGSMEFIHQTIVPVSNIMPIGIIHCFNSTRSTDSNSTKYYGQGFDIKLSPTFDETSDFYKNKVTVKKHNDGTFDAIVDNITGNAIKFEYESIKGNKRLRKIIDTQNRQITFWYNESDTGHLLKEIVYADNSKTQFLYNNGFIKRAINPSKTGIEILNSDKKVINIKDISYLNSITSKGINPLDNADILQDPLSSDNEVTFSYSSNSSITTTIKSEQKTKTRTEYTYPYIEPGAFVRNTMILSETTMFDNQQKTVITYERNNTLTSEIIYYNEGKDDEAIVTSTYNSDDNITQEKTESYFDVVADGIANERLLKIVDKTLEYKGKNVTKETVKITVKQSKNSADNLSEKTYVTTYDYHTSGNLFRVTYPDGRIQKMFYDQNGILTKRMTYTQDNPNQKIVEMLYSDENGLTTAIFDEQGEKTKIAYKDNTGIVRSIINPNKYKTNYITDENTDEITNIESNGNQNSFVYAGEFLTMLSSNNTEYKYEYDGRGRKTAVIVNDVPYINYSYAEDSYSNQTIIATYANGDVFEAVLDKFGKLLKISKNGTLVLRYAYDQKDRLISKADRIAQKATNYVYDLSGNVISKDDQDLSVKNSIDENGLTKTVFNINGDEQIYEYKYDSYNRLNKIVLPTEANEEVVYDSLSRVDTVTHPLHSDKINYCETDKRTTNFVSSILQTSGCEENGIPKWKSKTSYKYDKLGNIAEIFENGELTAEYEYDELNRLSKELSGGIEYKYTYDNNGNILTKEDLTNNTVKSYTYSGDKLDKLNEVKVCEYDSLGNPTSYFGKTLKWSHLRNLKRYDNIEFNYDASGIRTAKIKGSHETQYYYADDKLLGEQKSIAYYDYPDNDMYCGEVCTSRKLGDKIQYLYGTNGITGFRLKRESLANWEDYYYRKNLQGDITHILNNSNTAVAEYTYDAWGNHKTFALNDNKLVDISETETYTEEGKNNKYIAELNPIRYRSYYYDNETGLFYLQNRYYDPETGRFINADTVENAMIQSDQINGLNLYAYCLNNPVMKVDPSGQFVLSAFAIAMIIGVTAGVVIGAGGSIISQGLTNGWDNINWWQVGFDALIGGITGALGASGIGMAGSMIAGGILGFAGSVGGDLINGNDINWGKAAFMGALGVGLGAFSGAGAMNSKALMNGVAKHSLTLSVNKMSAQFGILATSGLMTHINQIVVKRLVAISLAKVGGTMLFASGINYIWGLF